MKVIRLLLITLFLAQPLFSFAARVDTLEVHSPAMQRKIKAAVVLPSSYQKSRKPYPVLYLLHGGTGSYKDWLTKTPDKTLLHRMADEYNLIIVTPDGGPTSYYFDSPLDKTSQYETFITKELVQKIDDSYYTVRDRKGRVIAGLSMGGHGAMYLASRHPELYSAAGSMSGVMNINTATWKVPEEFAALRAQNFARLLGAPKDKANPYPEYTAVGRTEELKNSGLQLILDVGVDDFLIDTNRDLHQRLLANGTPHTYIERPGEHTWEYWGNALPYQVLFFHNVLKGNGTNVP
ncbi:S-formylglutathione hydrolase FrmB [Pontibacter ummariensis]|uniref:S-formylglutathione hydrolase FrmB n=1 Tax=Pontibacter ummariensis TaxID=1610492 RepID=A0A239DAS6_9BACT|nr:alpha/beta hydrolase family protein [Pontibacter ummariensis]PRY14316.1 S-formylglutathione hydrolase FrmB [Pontibacter ummariensis]SNS28994.1 S-formylglutathione hydrolase FrmB [Pontibacter ummariensis]